MKANFNENVNFFYNKFIASDSATIKEDLKAEMNFLERHLYSDKLEKNAKYVAMRKFLDELADKQYDEFRAKEEWNRLEEIRLSLLNEDHTKEEADTMIAEYEKLYNILFYEAAHLDKYHIIIPCPKCIKAWAKLRREDFKFYTYAIERGYEINLDYADAD